MPDFNVIYLFFLMCFVILWTICLFPLSFDHTYDSYYLIIHCYVLVDHFTTNQCILTVLVVSQTHYRLNYGI